MTPVLFGISFIVALWLLKWIIKEILKMRILLQIPRSSKTKFFFGNALDFLMAPRNKLSYTFGKIAVSMTKYPIFCVWIFHISNVIIQRAKAAEEILNSNEFLQKGRFYNLLHPWLGQGLLTSTGQRWRLHRKLLTPSFHFKILDNFVPIFNEQSVILVKKLKDQAGKGSFDIYPYITLCTLDVICETAMGTKIRAQEGENVEYVKAISTISEILLTRNIKVWLLNPFIFALSHYGRKWKKILKILHQFTYNVIVERCREFEAGVRPDVIQKGNEMAFGQRKRLAFLDTLLEASDNFKKLSIKDIQEEVDTFMFEGHDTTSVAIGWVLHHLGWLPSIQIKVHEELDRVFGNSDRDVILEDLTKVKYLTAVIKESLRVTPSVPIFGRRVTQEVAICGIKIPADTDVLICPSLVAMDEEVFKDPTSFNPERFLNADAVNRHPFSFLSFSAGPRNCIGQKFALMEEKVILAHILRKFKVVTEVPYDETGMIPDIVLRPINGFKIKLMERTPL